MHVQAIADEIGCNKKTLYNHFPTLCKAQTIKWKQYLGGRKHIRLENIKQEITNLFEKYSCQGEKSNYSKIGTIHEKTRRFQGK
jgi:hypothetical protein